MEGERNQHANTIDHDELPRIQPGGNDTGENFGKNFKTISNTQYNPHHSHEENSFEGAEDREVNSQLEKHRYSNNKRNTSKKYRKLGNKTIQNGSFDGASMGPYIPASVVYGVN